MRCKADTVSRDVSLHCLLTAVRAIAQQDLTWEDREKVLRMLFASLRRQRQATIEPAAPKPSYESDDDEVDNPGPLRGIMSLAGPAQLA